MKKAMLFIDASNVYYDWLSLVGKKGIDWKKYIELVQKKFPDLEFKRTYYFTTETPKNENLLRMINRLPYCEVVTGRLQNKKIDIEAKHGVTCDLCATPITGNITIQVDKGTDVNLAVEMLRHGYNHSYETAVLVSRDADFSSVVKIVKSLGCNVELVLFDHPSISAQELSDCVDNIVLVNNTEWLGLEYLPSTP